MIDKEALRKERQKAYRAANSVRIAAVKKEHYLKNKDKILLRVRNHREKKKLEN